MDGKWRVRTEIKTIIFLGGSQGAKAINNLALQIAPALKEKGISIIHQAGANNIGEVKNNSIYIIEHDKQIWIKKAKITKTENKFISINPKYLHLEYKFEDVRIIAKALLTFTNL